MNIKCVLVAATSIDIADVRNRIEANGGGELSESDLQDLLEQAQAAIDQL